MGRRALSGPAYVRIFLDRSIAVAAAFRVVARITPLGGFFSRFLITVLE